jgi:hypothetical protein
VWVTYTGNRDLSWYASPLVEVLMFFLSPLLFQVFVISLCVIPRILSWSHSLMSSNLLTKNFVWHLRCQGSSVTSRILIHLTYILAVSDLCNYTVEYEYTHPSTIPRNDINRWSLICWFDYQNQAFQVCFLKYHWFVIIKVGNLRETVCRSSELLQMRMCLRNRWV